MMMGRRDGILIAFLFLIAVGSCVSGSAVNEQQPHATEIIARPEVYGNEPFTSICLVTQDGATYLVHEEDQRLAQELEKVYYKLEIKILENVHPPPGIKARAVVQILTYERYHHK